jgi:hypothetical protein
MPPILVTSSAAGVVPHVTVPVEPSSPEPASVPGEPSPAVPPLPPDELPPLDELFAPDELPMPDEPPLLDELLPPDELPLPEEPAVSAIPPESSPPDPWPASALACGVLLEHESEAKSTMQERGVQRFIVGAFRSAGPPSADGRSGRKSYLIKTT